MFQPVIPGAGLVGWRFLQNTYDAQFDAFSKSTTMQRDTDYFRDKIAEVTSAEALVKDRRLLNVALGAFGLQEDIDNRFFIRKVLEEGTIGQDALANRFTDKRYRALSEAFGFGPRERLQVGNPAFVERLIERFEAAQFEVAAGGQSDAMRVALYAQRQLPELAREDQSIDTKWFSIMGDPPLREVFEKAFNLPSQMGQLDIDRQLDIFKEKARAVFGSEDPSQFAQEGPLQDLITKYVVRDQISGINGGLSGRSIALTLLSGA